MMTDEMIVIKREGERERELSHGQWSERDEKNEK